MTARTAMRERVAAEPSRRPTAAANGAGAPASYPVAPTMERGNDGFAAATSDVAFAPLLGTFGPISLEQTIETASMLERQENKYVLGAGQLTAFLEDLRDRFAVLEIDGKRCFAYRSCYFDDDHKCFYDHLQGKRLRFKVRTRHYVDSGDIFFEVKLKDKRGATNKTRISTNRFAPPLLDEESRRLLHHSYGSLYRKEFDHDLRPSVMVSYRRATLVAKVGGERMTIDFGLRFDSDDGGPIEVGNDFIIVETKSSNGRGIADGVLKKHGIRSIRYCSKYCIGEILLGRVERYNNFRRVIRMVLDRMPAVAIPGGAPITDARRARDLEVRAAPTDGGA